MELKTILIAYTDDLWAKSVCTFIQGMGYRVEMTRTLSEMIRKVRNAHVILLDDDIEGMKAYDVVPSLKRIRSRIPVIAVSSQESLDFARKLRSSGIFYQAMKPIDSEEIRSAVECAFEKIERESLRKGLFVLLMPSDGPSLCII